jgi:hypothetical protein
MKVSRGDPAFEGGTDEVIREIELALMPFEPEIYFPRYLRSLTDVSHNIGGSAAVSIVALP